MKEIKNTEKEKGKLSAAEKIKIKILVLAAVCSGVAFAADYGSTATTATTSGAATPVESATTDAAITDAIKAKLAGNNLTSGFNIGVSTQHGIVALQGNVDTSSQADQAIQIAQSVPGVTDVDYSALKSKSSDQPMTDSAITAKVKGIFIREKLFGDKDISLTGVSVETTNGIVYLTGKVDTQQQADNAVNLAKSVSGVKSVKSTLEVNPVS